jgi:hypothetical protein
MGSCHGTTVDTDSTGINQVVTSDHQNDTPTPVPVDTSDYQNDTTLMDLLNAVDDYMNDDFYPRYGTH